MSPTASLASAPDRPAAEPVVAGARRGAAGRARSPRSSRPECGWAGQPGQPRSSAGSSSPSRTPTSAPAPSASGCSRSTAGAVDWTASSSGPGRCTSGERALTGRGAGRAHAGRHDLDDAGRRLLRLAHLPGRRRHGGAVGRGPGARRSPTCPDGRSTWPTRESGPPRSGSRTAGSPTTSSTRASAGSATWSRAHWRENAADAASTEDLRTRAEQAAAGSLGRRRQPLHHRGPR